MLRKSTCKYDHIRLFVEQFITLSSSTRISAFLNEVVNVRGTNVGGIFVVLIPEVFRFLPTKTRTFRNLSPACYVFLSNVFAKSLVLNQSVKCKWFWWIVRHQDTRACLTSFQNERRELKIRRLVEYLYFDDVVKHCLECLYIFPIKTKTCEKTEK